MDVRRDASGDSSHGGRGADGEPDPSLFTEQDRRALEAIERQLDIDYGPPPGWEPAQGTTGAREPAPRPHRVRHIAAIAGRSAVWIAATALVTTLYVGHAGRRGVTDSPAPVARTAEPVARVFSAPDPPLAPVSLAPDPPLAPVFSAPDPLLAPVSLATHPPSAPVSPAPNPRPVALSTVARPVVAPGTSGATAAPRKVVEGRAYWVQVGAFKNVDSAKRVAARVREHGKVGKRQVVVTYGGPGGSTVARVRVGPFASRDEAAAGLRPLRNLGYEPAITDERG